MKEVVEYILAGLIIISILPIYDYIMTNLYTPPELEVEQSVAAAFSDQVVYFLDEAALYGNLSSPIVDLTSLIEKKFPYFTQQYAFHVELVSIGIERVELTQSGKIKVYTRDKGNVTTLIIYSDYTLENKTATTPSKTLPNATYIYEIKPTYIGKQIIYIIAVLDTGLYRFIDYYEADNINKAYIGNYNSKLTIITDEPLNYETLPDNKEGVDIALIQYSQSVFHLQSGRVTYRKIYNLMIFFIINYIYYRRSEITYYAINTGQIDFKGTTYYMHEASLLELQYMDMYEYLGLFLINEEHEFLGSEYIPIMAPIYNLPVVILKDSSNQYYIASWYPHRIEIGYTLPSGVPVTTVRVVKRLGMIDYYITVTMWRKTI